jgi:triphosphoribosyl-dephospho-CoA synthase
MTGEPAPGSAQAAFLRACRLDVDVFKPGNVSLQSPGHGMTADHFLASALAAAPELFSEGKPVGRRILDGVTASFSAARCNTNLGILLLCAPLASAFEEAGAAGGSECLRDALQRTLDSLTVADARNAFRAIALANPGGLGTAADQDVHQEPTVDLKSAMALAADRDLIARQYATGYLDLFETGLPSWQAAVAGDPGASRRAMLCTFLTFLARFDDSHIVRKHGPATARAVSLEAASWLPRAVADGEAARPGLMKWDARLKAAGINPGTSADLAVATAFVAGMLFSHPGRVATRAG